MAGESTDSLAHIQVSGGNARTPRACAQMAPARSTGAPCRHSLHAGWRTDDAHPGGQRTHPLGRPVFNYFFAGPIHHGLA